MHRELLEELSVITEEEKRILEERKGIDTHLYTEKKELIVDSEKLLSKGKLIQVRPHTRFVHFPKHRHNYVEVIYMCRGTTTHILDGNTVVLEEGNILFLNQNAVQEILPAGEHDIAVNFIILPEFFSMVFSILDMKEGNFLKDFLIDALCGKSRNTSYLYFHVADILPIQNLIENMVWTIRNEQPNKRRCNQITMGLLLLQLLNHMDRMEAGKGVYEKELMDMVHEYIEAHYKNGSLSELSAILGYDLYWLSREIKKRAGKTYKDLLLDKRMKQTAYLLKETTLPVVDIIESIGYDNTSYFYKKFKETYGVSPKEYREGKNNEQN